MSRIELNDDIIEILLKMGEGNPGASNVIAKTLTSGATIDPHGFAGGLGCILMMDTYKIYGSDIWMLYKDVCNEDIANVLACLRAVQLGIISGDELHYAISHHGEGITLSSIMTQV